MNYFRIILLSFLLSTISSYEASSNLINKFNTLRLKVLRNKENATTPATYAASATTDPSTTTSTSTTIAPASTSASPLKYLPIDESYINLLFANEVEKIVREGPANRFWDIIMSEAKESLDGIVQKGAKFKRQVHLDSQTKNSISQSPLIVNSMVSGHQSSQSSPNARFIDAQSEVGLSVSKRLMEVANKTGVNPQEALKQFQAPDGLCPFRKNIPCDPNDRFRSFDGSCNNLANPWFGKAEIPYKRYMDTTYDDGKKITHSIRLLDR